VLAAGWVTRRASEGQNDNAKLAPMSGSRPLRFRLSVAMKKYPLVAKSRYPLVAR